MVEKLRKADSPTMKGAKFKKRNDFIRKREFLRDLFEESEGKHLNLFLICFLVTRTNTILEFILL